MPGVVGAEPGIGGNDSIRLAPNEDVGLKAFIPAVNPVACGCKAEGVKLLVPVPLDTLVAPVCWLPRLENIESENVPDVTVVDVFWLIKGEPIPVKLGNPVSDEGDLFASSGLLLENDEAMLDMAELCCDVFVDALGVKVPKPLKPVGWGCIWGDCCCCLCCSWIAANPPPMASSINVGGFGTGGAFSTGTPNGFLDPVW